MAAALYAPWEAEMVGDWTDPVISCTIYQCLDEWPRLDMLGIRNVLIVVGVYIIIQTYVYRQHTRTYTHKYGTSVSLYVHLHTDHWYGVYKVQSCRSISVSYLLSINAFIVFFNHRAKLSLWRRQGLCLTGFHSAVLVATSAASFGWFLFIQAAEYIRSAETGSERVKCLFFLSQHQGTSRSLLRHKRNVRFGEPIQQKDLGHQRLLACSLFSSQWWWRGVHAAETKLSWQIHNLSASGRQSIQ